MSHKLCPFGFYSFYVNKQVAQAGGCHHCVEERCALWDTYYDEYGNTVGQCALMSITESLRSMADTSDTSSRTLPIAGAPRTKATAAIGGVLEKLKAKKAAKEAAAKTTTPTPTATTPTPTATTPTPTATTPTPTAPTAAPTAPATPDTPTTAATTPAATTATAAPVVTPAPPPPPAPPLPNTAPVAPIKDEQAAEKEIEDLLKPPSIPISELPVISVSDKQETPKPTTPSSPPAAPPAPTATVEVKIQNEAQDGGK